MYNPKFKDFLKEKPNITIIGLYWAGYWRLALAVVGVYIALAVVVAILA